jgi:hypothetical protein
MKGTADMEEQRKIRKEIEERWKKLGLIEENDELLKFDAYVKPLIGEVDDGKCDLQLNIMGEILKHTCLDHIDVEFKLEDNNK